MTGKELYERFLVFRQLSSLKCIAPWVDLSGSIQKSWDLLADQLEFKPELTLYRKIHEALTAGKKVASVGGGRFRVVLGVTREKVYYEIDGWKPDILSECNPNDFRVLEPLT